MNFMKSAILIDQKKIHAVGKTHEFIFFFAKLSTIMLIVLCIFASAPHSSLTFVACLWALALIPFVFFRFSIFEPIAIYLTAFLTAFTVKPLMNDYLSSTGDGYLFALSGNESLYKLGFPYAALFVLIHVYLVHIIYYWITSNKRQQLFSGIRDSRFQSKDPTEKEYKRWKKTGMIGIIIYLPAFMYFIVFIQGLNFSEYASNRNELLRGQGLTWLLATFGTPLSIIYIYLALMKSKIKNSRKLHILVALLCVISGQVIAPGRGNILSILLAFIIIYWWKKGEVQLKRLFAIGIVFIIFSFAVLQAREGQTQFNNESAVFFIVQDMGMFDYFVIYTGQMLSENLDLSYGAQLLRNLYVFLPRFIFPTKPIYYSTLEIQDANKLIPLESSQVSFTPFVEWLYNFGIPGIFIGSILLALTLAAFFRLLAKRGSDIRIIVYVLFLPAFVIGYIKGGFSLAFMFFLLSPAWLAVMIYFGVRYLRLFNSTVHYQGVKKSESISINSDK